MKKRILHLSEFSAVFTTKNVLSFLTLPSVLISPAVPPGCLDYFPLISLPSLLSVPPELVMVVVKPWEQL
jgi:hypothetical protein